MIIQWCEVKLSTKPETDGTLRIYPRFYSQVNADDKHEIRTHVYFTIFMKMINNHSLVLNYANCKIHIRCRSVTHYVIQEVGNMTGHTIVTPATKNLIKVFTTPVILSFQEDCKFNSLECRVKYLYLSRQYELQEVSPGVINCSVPHYHVFEGMEQ